MHGNDPRFHPGHEGPGPGPHGPGSGPRGPGPIPHDPGPVPSPEAGPPGPPPGCCAGGGAESHAALTLGQWHAFFWEAYRQVHVDILKDKIRKAWGKNMEAVADAVVEAMEKEWRAAHAKERSEEERRAAQQELVERIVAASAKGPQ